MTYEMRMKDIREESLAEGEAIGFAKGEAEEKLATAKRLLSIGLSVQDVAKGTSLSVEQVEKIKAELALLSTLLPPSCAPTHGFLYTKNLRKHTACADLPKHERLNLNSLRYLI